MQVTDKSNLFIFKVFSLDYRYPYENVSYWYCWEIQTKNRPTVNSYFKGHSNLGFALVLSPEWI